MLFNKTWQLSKDLKNKLSEKGYIENGNHYYSLYYVYSLAHFFLGGLNPSIADSFIKDIKKILKAY